MTQLRNEQEWRGARTGSTGSFVRVRCTRFSALWLDSRRERLCAAAVATPTRPQSPSLSQGGETIWQRRIQNDPHKKQGFDVHPRLRRRVQVYCSTSSRTRAKIGSSSTGGPLPMAELKGCYSTCLCLLFRLFFSESVGVGGRHRSGQVALGPRGRIHTLRTLRSQRTGDTNISEFRVRGLLFRPFACRSLKLRHTIPP